MGPHAWKTLVSEMTFDIPEPSASSTNTTTEEVKKAPPKAPVVSTVIYKYKQIFKRPEPFIKFEEPNINGLPE